MPDNINRNAFQRRSFDLHIAKLLELRRVHRHSSFFDAEGYIRDYAYRYLRAWMSGQPIEEGDEVPRVHSEADSDQTLDALPDAATLAQITEALRFAEILRILDQEGAALYAADETQDYHADQMQELSRAYQVVDDLRWDQSEDDDNVVYLKGD